MNSSSILNDVLTEVGKHTKKRVLLASEIYYDLDIYGDDLYDIFDSLISKYGTDFSGVDVSKIAPGEGGGFIGSIARSLGFRPYESFKVGNLVDLTVQGTGEFRGHNTN